MDLTAEWSVGGKTERRHIIIEKPWYNIIFYSSITEHHIQLKSNWDENFPLGEQATLFHADTLAIL